MSDAVAASNAGEGQDGAFGDAPSILFYIHLCHNMSMEEPKPKQHVAVLSVLVSGALLFGIGYTLGTKVVEAPEPTILPASATAPGAPENVDFRPLWFAWEALNERFVAPNSTTTISDEEKVWGIIGGLADAYDDPYTVFFPPEEKKVFEESITGNFEGVGMEVGIRDELLTIVAPLKGSPAEQAGVEPNDRIIKIEDEVATEFSIEEAVSRIRGEKGTDVTITVFRESTTEQLDITITRDTIVIPTVETEILFEGETYEAPDGTIKNKEVVVLRLFSFNAQSIRLFRDGLRDFVISGTDKLVLDLRGNPGGFLEAAVEIGSLFLELGKPIVAEDFGGKRVGSTFRSKGYDVFRDDLKLAILINEGSASASEILAGALKEHGIATLVGKKTFGKGSVQELLKVTPDTSLKITIARWLTPGGHSISGNGIEPDIEVDYTVADREEGRDPQLDAAVEYLLNEE